MRVLIIGACLAAAHFGVATAARALTVPVGESAIAFDPGAGFCALDRTAHDIDRTLLEAQEQLHRQNALLAMVLRCDRLVGLRDGTESTLGTYGILLAPYDEDGGLTPTSGARPALLEELAAYLGAEPDEMAERVAAGVEHVREALADVGTDLTLSETRSLGLLDRDDNALYLGVLSSYAVGGAPQTMASVSAITLAGGYMLTYSVYRPYEDEQSFVALLDLARPVMRDLVAANPGPAAEGDGTTFGDIAIPVAAIVLLLGAGFVILAPIAIRILNRRARNRGGDG